MGGMELEWDYSYLIQYGLSSAVMTVLVFRLVSPAVSSRLFPAYNRLRQGDKAEWNDRVISNINSVINTVLCSYVLLFEDGVHKDPVWFDCKLSRKAVSLVIGFCIGDLICMLLWCQMKRGELIGFLFHHLASVYAYYFVSVNGVLCFFAMLRLLCEFSNPFMNQRWLMEASGFKRTDRAYVVNGVLFIVSFFLCRILTMPWFWLKIWQTTGTELTRPLGHIEVTVMYIPSIILDTLNLYWFYKIYRGLAKVVSQMSPKKPEENHND